MVQEEKRTSAVVLAEIGTVLGGLDGIATQDALQLGRLIEEYGHAKSGETLGPLIAKLFDGIEKDMAQKAEPWKRG